MQRSCIFLEGYPDVETIIQVAKSRLDRVASLLSSLAVASGPLPAKSVYWFPKRS